MEHTLGYTVFYDFAHEFFTRILLLSINSSCFFLELKSIQNKFNLEYRYEQKIQFSLDTMYVIT